VLPPRLLGLTPRHPTRLLQPTLLLPTLLLLVMPLLLLLVTPLLLLATLPRLLATLPRKLPSNSFLSAS
jgi:hypothetical protein